MRRIVLVAVVGLVAVLGVRGVQGELLQDIGATFQQVAQSLAGAFPKVEAHVTLGEICDRLRGVFGVHAPSVTF